MNGGSDNCENAGHKPEDRSEMIRLKKEIRSDFIEILY
jgi:hypothetical protein